MKHFANFITKHYIVIVFIAIVLLIPAAIGYFNTRVNYDILVYLPQDNETIQGQNILTDDFGLGGYAFVMLDNMSNYDILKLEDKIKQIDGVNEVLSIADVVRNNYSKRDVTD